MYIVIVNYTEKLTKKEASTSDFHYRTAASLLEDFESAATFLMDPATTGIILTGGPQYVSEINKYPELYKEVELIQIAANYGKYVLGICLGFQLSNFAYGNSVVRLSEPRIGCGYLNIHSVNTSDNSRCFECLNNSVMQHTFSFHRDGVETNSSDHLQVVATSQCGIVYAVCHRTLPIYGIQFHPEVITTDILRWLTRYKETSKTYIASAEDLENVRNIFFQSFPGKNAL
jgi:GMP synthase-like glutamine amidotransferase